MGLNFKSLSLLFLMMLTTTGVDAQSFDLYFSNNVTDVENLNDETIEEYQNGLKWTKIDHSTQNVYSNYVEVDEVKQMFASTRMKTRADQQQFWRMRDHSLLCFRINSGDGKTGEYGVQASDGYGTVLSLTVTKYFYSNIPLQDKPIEFKVWKIGEVGDTVRFKYASDDWDDEQLYIFQLDSKRQLDGESYTLEYDLSYADTDGDLQEEKHYLELKSRNFQSFYVSPDKTLGDIFLMSGSTTAPKEGQKKLRLNLKRLIPGVSPYNKYSDLTLTTRFELDKHENRELVNFNWIGSGLYERFDTLYVKLKKPNGDDIRSARMNVVQVDEDGNEVLGGAPVKYEGWDEGRKVHKVLTNGNPAYIEILPPAKSNTFYPMVLKYRGATDPLTNIVDEERCVAEAMAVLGNVNYADFAISSQRFKALNDEKRIVMYRGEEHALVTLKEYDLTGRALTDEVSFSADGCQNGLKIFKGVPIQKYGELLVTFSTAKNGARALRRAMANAPELKVYAVNNNNALLQTITPQDGSTSVSFSKFERDYYDVGYDLTEMTLDSLCRLKLVSGKKVYDKLPYFSRFLFDREASDDQTKNGVNDLTDNVTKGDKDKPFGYDMDGAFSCGIPANLRIETPLKGFTINTSIYIDFLKKVMNYKFTAQYKKANKYQDQNGNPDGSKMSKMREDFETYRDWDRLRTSDSQGHEILLKEKGATGGFPVDNDQLKLDSWVFKEFDDIFSLPTPGFTITGGVKLAGTVGNLGKLKNKDGSAKNSFTITYGNLFLKFAYGAILKNPIKMLSERFPALGTIGNFLETNTNWLTINALAEAALDISIGFKNYRAADYGWSDRTECLLIQAMLTGRGGVDACIHNPPNGYLHLQAGVRAGAKLGVGYSFVQALTNSHHDHGGKFVGLVGVEGYAFVRGLIVNGKVSMEAHLGDQILFPKDNSDNPFHPKYPSWAINSPRQQPISSYWNNPSLSANPVSPWNTTADSDEQTGAESVVYGKEIVSDVASTANPHFLDEHTIVYDAPGTDDDLNSAHIALMDTKTKTVQRLSKEGVKATNHMRSKNTTHEVVVYEEMTRPITAEEVSADPYGEQLARQQSIVAHVRDNDENAPDMEWHRSVVCAADGDLVNIKPVVTQQEDGRVACIWQQGHIVPISSQARQIFAKRRAAAAALASETQETTETQEATEANDSTEMMLEAGFSTAMNGHLMLSVFDHGVWSKPVPLFELNETNVVKQYDLVMRNDTVLVGMNMTRNFYDDEKCANQFTYASIPFNTMEPAYVQEQLHPMRFFMNRVGDNAVIAMLYEKNDTLSDIFVKTVAMDGHANGSGGNNLGARFCSPNLVKVICDREAANLDDFAILWAEMSNTVRGDNATAQTSGEARLILNASRISLQPSFFVTAPLTMGAETEGMLLHDFDGFLDDQHMKVVYSLSSLQGDKGVIMENERYFSNGYLFDVNVNNEALLSSNTLPVTVTVYNTGTSPISNVTPTINGQTFNLEESWVQPLSYRDFSIEYPIDDNFSGYLETSVKVDYRNVFRAKYHALHRSRSLETQTSNVYKTRASLEDIELRILGQDIEDGINTFAVELTDRSVRGLRPNHHVLVGLYSQPAGSFPISDQAVTMVRASDFEIIGGQRKAYAKVAIPGIVETTSAYMQCHVIDESVTDPAEDPSVENRQFVDNVHMVYLQPSNDPTDITSVRFEENKNALDVKVTPEDGGVRITGLPVSDNTNKYRIRIFEADGKLCFNTVSTSSTLFVPLSRHGIYLLSTGKDVLKFNY